MRKPLKYDVQVVETLRPASLSLLAATPHEEQPGEPPLRDKRLELGVD